MTVRELRQLLFDVEDQDAKVVVITQDCLEGGHVKKTYEVGCRRIDGKDVLGHSEDPAGWISILTKS